MNCILKRKRLLVIFPNRSVNDLIQGELYKYHLLADYNPEQAAGGLVGSRAEQPAESGIHQMSRFMSIKPSKSIIKSCFVCVCREERGVEQGLWRHL